MLELNKVYNMDCIEGMKLLPDNSIDSIVTDPPYEIGFMGKWWDSTGIANNVDMRKECLRVLKPWWHLLSFAATRTYHRMACAIEDAGFEVRDMIEWVYGSGFPKSLNIGKAVDKLQGNEREVVATKEQSGAKFKTVQEQMDNGGFNDPNRTDFKIDKGTSEWEGWGTALKPAHEPICMARKPLSEKTVAENVLKYGTGGINIDESRVGTEEKLQPSSSTKMKFGGNAMLESKTMNDPDWIQNSNGRFPANLIHDGSDEVVSLFPNTNKQAVCKTDDKSWLQTKLVGWELKKPVERKLYLDDQNGWSASRFFKECNFTSEDIKWQDQNQSSYVKYVENNVNSQDRHTVQDDVKTKNSDSRQDESQVIQGCIGNSKECIQIQKNVSVEKCENTDTTEITTNHLKSFGSALLATEENTNSERSEADDQMVGWQRFLYQPKASKKERNKGVEDGNNHPTVKPIALMEYLVKLVSKEWAVVIDPFAWSGSTMIACKRLWRQYIGFELDQWYCEIAENRVASY